MLRPLEPHLTLPCTSEADHSANFLQSSSKGGLLWWGHSAMACGHTPLEAGAVASAYNDERTRLAVFDLDGRLSIWQREGSSPPWALRSSLPTDGLRITSLCWARREFGSIVAGGAADGSVTVWQEAPGDETWQLAAVLREGTLAVQELAFAPPQLGPVLAAAYADGAVRCVQW